MGMKPKTPLAALASLALMALMAPMALWTSGDVHAQVVMPVMPTPPATQTPDQLAPKTDSPSRPGLLSGRPMAPTVSPEITQTREHLSRQQWVEAADLINAALAKRPRDPQWRFLQGVLFAETGKRQEAISTFELLTEDFPELSEPYNNLAALYVEQNDLQKARLLLERAIQNRPDYALALENLADVYSRLALQTYEKAAGAKQPSPSVGLKLDYMKKMPAIRANRILTNR